MHAAAVVAPGGASGTMEAVDEHRRLALRVLEMARGKVRSSLERLSALRSDCCNCAGATDQSSVIMTFQAAGGTDVKKIDHYEGCEKTPDWLYDVENAIDAALETERWLGKKVVGKPLHPHQHRQP